MLGAGRGGLTPCVMAGNTRRMEPQRPGSEVHLDEWVSPHICDPDGYLKPGKVLEWMDVVGVLAATRHCRRPVVTASVDGVELRDPIRVGEHVALRASVAYTSERSIGIRAAMSSSGPDALPAREVLTAYMTFVGLDESGKPTVVPQMRPETPAERGALSRGPAPARVPAEAGAGRALGADPPRRSPR